MAAPTLILLFASGLIVTVALIGYGVLVLTDNRPVHRASSVADESTRAPGAAE